MWIKTISTTYITSARMATTEKTNTTKCCGCGERGLFLNFGGSAHLGSHCENHCDNRLSCGQDMPSSEKDKKKDFISYHRDICMSMFIAELLTIAKNWNPPSRYCRSSPNLEKRSWHEWHLWQTSARSCGLQQHLQQTSTTSFSFRMSLSLHYAIDLLWCRTVARGSFNQAVLDQSSMQVSISTTPL